MIANFFREKLFFLLQFLKYSVKLHSSKGGKLLREKTKNLNIINTMNNKETFYLVEVYHIGTATGSLLSLDHVRKCSSLEAAMNFGSGIKKNNGWFTVTKIDSCGRVIVFDSSNN